MTVTIMMIQSIATSPAAALVVTLEGLVFDMTMWHKRNGCVKEALV